MSDHNERVRTNEYFRFLLSKQEYLDEMDDYQVDDLWFGRWASKYGLDTAEGVEVWMTNEEGVVWLTSVRVATGKQSSDYCTVENRASLVVEEV